MDYKFSISHLTVLGLTPPELVHMAEKVGFDFVSLRTIKMGLPGEPDYSLENNPALYKATKEALQHSNIKLLDIELARIYDRCDVRQYEKAIEIAAELGGSQLISSLWTPDVNFVIEQVHLLCEIAAQYGITVNVEPVPISHFKTIESVTNVLNAVPLQNKGLLIDMHHFHRASEQLETLSDLPKEWIQFIHLCDAQAKIPASYEEMRRILREERLFLGEGGIDVATILNHLPKVPLAIELPHKERLLTLGFEKYAAKCLERAKQYVHAYCV